MDSILYSSRHAAHEVAVPSRRHSARWPLDPSWHAPIAALVFGSFMLVCFFASNFVLWLLEEHPFYCGLFLMALPGIGWYFGTKEGNERLARAKTMQGEAEIVLSRERDVDRKYESLERESRAVAAMREATEDKNRGDDIRYIDAAHALPLEKRIETSVRVGAYPKESRQDYLRRRGILVERLVRNWKEAQRTGHPFSRLSRPNEGYAATRSRIRLARVAEPTCTAFPVTAVHIDHIIPRSKGGSNHPDNLQALCSYCNVKAGNRT